MPAPRPRSSARARRPSRRTWPPANWERLPWMLAAPVGVRQIVLAPPQEQVEILTRLHDALERLGLHDALERLVVAPAFGLRRSGSRT